MRAITYARAATFDQAQGRTLLDSQERACCDFARSHGWVVVESVRDVASGLSTGRPGMDRVRRILHEGGAEIVLAYDADRLARDPSRVVALMDEIEGAGARLEFVTGHPESTEIGRLILAARALIADTQLRTSKPRTGGED